jgi:hypothetical protein
MLCATSMVSVFWVGSWPLDNVTQEERGRGLGILNLRHGKTIPKFMEQKNLHECVAQVAYFCVWRWIFSCWARRAWLMIGGRRLVWEGSTC